MQQRHRKWWIFFYIKAEAPIIFGLAIIIMVVCLFWCVVIEYNKDLREHLLMFPQNQWLLPCSEDEQINRILQITWFALNVAGAII